MIIDTGLDFKTKSPEEAWTNLGIRAATFAGGTFFKSAKNNLFKPKSGFEKQMSRNADVLNQELFDNLGDELMEQSSQSTTSENKDN